MYNNIGWIYRFAGIGPKCIRQSSVPEISSNIPVLIGHDCYRHLPQIEQIPILRHPYLVVSFRTVKETYMIPFTH